MDNHIKAPRFQLKNTNAEKHIPTMTSWVLDHDTMQPIHNHFYENENKNFNSLILAAFSHCWKIGHKRKVTM